MSGIRRLLKLAQENVNDEISRSTESNNPYSRGLAREGYAGGYADALADVELALNGITPDRRGWWTKRKDA